MLAAGAAKSKEKITTESNEVNFYILYNTINRPLYRPTLLRIVMSVTERDTEVQVIVF